MSQQHPNHPHFFFDREVLPVKRTRLGANGMPRRAPCAAATDAQLILRDLLPS